MVFEYIRKTASALLKDGKNVVLDATNLGRKKRKNLTRTKIKNQKKAKKQKFI